MEKAKSFWNRKLQISLANLLSVAFSLFAIGTIVGMVNESIGWLIIGLFIMLIVIKSLPYIRKLQDIIEKVKSE